MRPVQVVVLAAGKGTRMRSRIPKVAHPIAGRAMLEHVLRAAAAALAPAPEATAADTIGPEAAEDHHPRFSIVVGHERDAVRKAVRWAPPGRVAYILQEPQLGTGHATLSARPVVEAGEVAPGTVLVLYGDTPLVRAATLRALLDEHARRDATLTFLTAEVGADDEVDGPSDYGRVLRDDRGGVRGIVEARHASPAELAIREINSGIYCFDAAWLWSRLERLEPHPNGELYLTDLVDMAVGEGRVVGTSLAPLAETMGVNDRVALAEAERIVRGRLLRDLMLGGVTVQDPANTYVECDVRIGQDTTLLPGTMLHGATVIGARCVIGPGSVIRDSRVGDDCVVLASFLEEATMEPGAHVGPMSHLRPGAHVATGAQIGNFAEVKNTLVGPDVQMHHFSYLGDAEVGARTNIAAGTITANFAPDGTKQRTTIGVEAFIGCDTILIAPVSIGEGAQTGAGAVVRRDVPPYGVAVGMPARVIRHRRPPVPSAEHPADGTDTGIDRGTDAGADAGRGSDIEGGE